VICCLSLPQASPGAPVAGSCRVVGAPGRLALPAVVAVAVLDGVARVALAQAQTVVTCAVAGSVCGLVLELRGAGVAGGGGHGDAGVLQLLRGAHVAVARQPGHAAHPAVEIGVAGGQRGMLRGRREGGS